MIERTSKDKKYRGRRERDRLRKTDRETKRGDSVRETKRVERRRECERVRNSRETEKERERHTIKQGDREDREPGRR